MSFPLIRNLGLALLVLLMIAVAVMEYRTNAAHQATLDDMVNNHFPAQSALLRGSAALAAAELHFDRYDQRERVRSDEILALLGRLEAEILPQNTRATRQLGIVAANFAAYLDEELIDPSGD